MRAALVIAAAALLGGCASTETVRFQPSAQQQALVRDGNPALVSRKKSSIVLIRPAAREFRKGGRPVFVVAVNNLTNAPLDFRVADVEATQVVEQQDAPLKVITYEELVQEERNRQIAAAILVGLAAGANAAAASQAGRYNSTTTVHTPRGTYTAHTTGYSPTAAAIAQANASVENEAAIAATIERGQVNMAVLERDVIKDNTLLPGEWYGGQLHLQPLAGSTESKPYRIVLKVGPDRHEIDMVQGATK